VGSPTTVSLFRPSASPTRLRPVVPETVPAEGRDREGKGKEGGYRYSTWVSLKCRRFIMHRRCDGSI
jgi:hypothetical protein